MTAASLMFAVYFNPRSPHGERRYRCVVAKGCQISIHAPRTGSDPWFVPTVDSAVEISIHAPRTGSDSMTAEEAARLAISIHAPRTGSDIQQQRGRSLHQHFNPRSPHGERRMQIWGIDRPTRFQSTLPARGATGKERARYTAQPFQSTLPARGATVRSAVPEWLTFLFQSTLPARGATDSNFLLRNR